MFSFKDQEEYRLARERAEADGIIKKKENRTQTEGELVIEENTIYEIDPNCEKCLKYYRNWKKKSGRK